MMNQKEAKEITAKGNENAPKLKVTLVPENENMPPRYKFSLLGIDASAIVEGHLKSYNYSVRETVVPDGYNKPSYLTKDGNPLVTSDPSAGDGGIIVNTPHSAVSLPNTGGSGTELFTALGALLLALGGGLLLLKKRRTI